MIHENRHVSGATTFFEMLQPVAGDDGGTASAKRGVVGLDELPVIHPLQAIVRRQHRSFLGRSQIGENQSVAFLNRVPGLAHLVLERAAVRLTGLFEATALGVELPAVIAAADAVLLDLAIVRGWSAVAATRVQQARAATAVAE
jgi:hypothetical protein